MKPVFDQTLAFALLVLFAQAAACQEASKAWSHEEQLLDSIARGNLEETKKIAAKFDLDSVVNLPMHVLASPNADIVEFLRDRCDFNITDLQIAAIRGDHNEIENLLGELDEKARKAALETWYVPPMSSFTPLMLAVRNGHAQAVGKLIAFEANVNEATHYTRTPLASAAELGHVDIVERLMKAGADVDLAADGYTALMRACCGGRPKAAELLLKAGADPNQKRHDGQRALHFAAKSGNAECVRLLLQHHADIDAVAYEKDTAMTYAQRYKNQGVIKILRGAKAD